MTVLILLLQGPHYFALICLFGRTNHVIMTAFILPMLVNHSTQNQDVVPPIIKLKFNKELKINQFTDYNFNFDQLSVIPKVISLSIKSWAVSTPS